MTSRIRQCSTSQHCWRFAHFLYREQAAALLGIILFRSFSQIGETQLQNAEAPYQAFVVRLWKHTTSETMGALIKGKLVGFAALRSLFQTCLLPDMWDEHGYGGILDPRSGLHPYAIWLFVAILLPTSLHIENAPSLVTAATARAPRTSSKSSHHSKEPKLQRHWSRCLHTLTCHIGVTNRMLKNWYRVKIAIEKPHAQGWARFFILGAKDGEETARLPTTREITPENACDNRVTHGVYGILPGDEVALGDPASPNRLCIVVEQVEVKRRKNCPGAIFKTDVLSFTGIVHSKGNLPTKLTSICVEKSMTQLSFRLVKKFFLTPVHRLITIHGPVLHELRHLTANHRIRFASHQVPRELAQGLGAAHGLGHRDTDSEDGFSESGSDAEVEEANNPASQATLAAAIAEQPWKLGYQAAPPTRAASVMLRQPTSAPPHRTTNRSLSSAQTSQTQQTLATPPVLPPQPTPAPSVPPTTPGTKRLPGAFHIANDAHSGAKAHFEVDRQFGIKQEIRNVRP